MSVIFYVMKEEYDRLLEAEHVYGKSILKEAQGAPRLKQYGSNQYLYLQKREGQRVVYKYVGRADSPKAQKVLESVERRRKRERLLKMIRKDLKDVKKVLRGKI